MFMYRTKNAKKTMSQCEAIKIIGRQNGAITELICLL